MTGDDLVLASASPRRAQLLRELGVAFAQHPTEIDESAVPGESPLDYVVRLAREKARDGEQTLGDRALANALVVMLRHLIRDQPPSK